MQESDVELNQRQIDDLVEFVFSLQQSSTHKNFIRRTCIPRWIQVLSF